MLSLFLVGAVLAFFLARVSVATERISPSPAKHAFLESLIAEMTVPEMVMQLHLMFADNVVGPASDNSLYDFALTVAPTAGVGLIHDWYPTNVSQYNSLITLDAQKSRLKIPPMVFGECLHGVGSFKQSMFPQSIGMAASFDTNLVHRVGSAIGTEARSIGIHGCFSPVLDLGLDPRWGRVQEAWGEDMLLTSQMGVAMASGMSKNSSWDRDDAVVPVMKHFAAHGSVQGGVNGGPSMILGYRQLLETMLRPFKAVVELGGIKGVMMAYSELDAIPAHIHPTLYQNLDDWGFDGFVTADDTGMKMLETRHAVADGPADTIAQWLNAGGCSQFYDYDLPTFMEAITGSIDNGTITKSTLEARVRRILNVKYDLGLFANALIPENMSIQALTDTHVPLTLEAAQKSIVLLENRNRTLPIRPLEQKINKIALIGPFSDTLNYGDYSGQFGAYPTSKSSTIRQSMIEYLAANASGVELVSSWGVNQWEYNAQVNIPGYLLSANGTKGGLLGTYFADTNFTEPIFTTLETPNRDWGLYPPNGLPSNNFSVRWDGFLSVPVDADVLGYIGVALSANTTAKLYIDDELIQHTVLTTKGNLLSNIPGFDYINVNSSAQPPGSASFRFVKGKTHKIRLDFQAYNLAQKYENVQSINAEVELFWNLVDRTDPVQQAVDLAEASDVIVLAAGASWGSDGESGDRATLQLSPSQTILTEKLYDLGKPVILVLQGGRPFSIPELYSRSAAVLMTFFPGQSGGKAISDVLFGLFNPGGRVPLSVPYDVGTLPVFYNFKTTARYKQYIDIQSYPSYSFGYGLSYTTFDVSEFASSSTSFSEGSIITFSVTIANNGTFAGSYTPQVYLLKPNRSATTQAEKKLVAFTRVYLAAGTSTVVKMELEVDRYLPIVNRKWEWELEKGDYVFALLEDSRWNANTSVNVTMTCA
ncbi:hypothetical protein HYFRA_00014045 [Hymenoscyphus fraxineus]|uniref:xylan 1,4-beta-xylosidase n=1 Tax=Hymenoscyphus fraxineus TaxID=746836 RepID=A0A9N9LA30_9HELO|nr:hypothetical protein HYFRA_00014045 [Hymenoscyphus fraxineus]